MKKVAFPKDKTIPKSENQPARKYNDTADNSKSCVFSEPVIKYIITKRP